LKNDNLSQFQKAGIVEEFGFPAADAQAWYSKYHAHRFSHTVERGIVSELTFMDYMFLASEAGLLHPSQVGIRSHQYQLGRYGDRGGYSLNNCRFITCRENRKEAHTNGKSDAWNETMRGQTKENSDRLKNLSEKLKGRTKFTHSYLAEKSIRYKNDPRRQKIYDDSRKRMTGRTKENDPRVVAHSEKRAYSFTVSDPNGVVYTDKNLNEFCKRHNLHQGAMAAVCRGAIRHYKGWTGKYV
jgi:hypothetical protein